MVALGGCNQEAVIEGTSINQNKNVRTITMQAEIGADSRIAFQEDESKLNLLWEQNDGFSVMAGTAVQTPVTFTLTDGEGTNKGRFTGDIACNDGATLYAVWPIMTEGMSGEHQCYWDLAGQKGVLDDQYTFMVGSGVYNETGNTSISFRYMTAAVRMNLLLPENVKKITKVDVQVDGAYRRTLVNIDSGGLIFDDATNGGITIEQEFDVIDGSVNVVAYFFAWEYSALNDGKVVVTDENGNNYEGTLASGNIRPGVLYDTTVNFNDAFVEEEDGSYTIYSEKGWSMFASMVKEGNTFEGKTVKLGADIDLKNELQEPIGLMEEINWEAVNFAGTLDGQNHCIKNLMIDNSIGRFTGLFAFVQRATFKNLRIASGEVRAGGEMSNYTGALLGYGLGVTVINCHNEGCKVYNTTRGATGGLTGSLYDTNDRNTYSYIIASTNSAEVCAAYCPSGITGGGWSGYVHVVACVNTGKISYPGTELQGGIWAAGISGALGGSDSNWMYGCFVDCEIVPGSGHAALVADGGSSYVNIHYSYSANTSIQLIGAWGGNGMHNETVGYSSYNDAVDNLNKGIQMYNWKGTVPCTYKFVRGDKPTLVYAEPNTNPGAGNNNFGNGGKF